jgi:spore maturation protein CgeB
MVLPHPGGCAHLSQPECVYKRHSWYGNHMRLVIFGLTLSSSWGNGHATIWRGLCKALGRGGHRVKFFERDVPYYAQHRDLVEPGDYELVLYPSWEEIRDPARSAVEEADAAIVTSYCPDSRAACELVLSSGRAIKVFYDLDTPVTLERLRTQGEVDYIPSYGLGPFDLVLSYTGGKALEELRRKLGARRVAPLYGGVDPDLHRPVTASPQYLSDLSYLGTYAADRQSTLHKLFLEPARHFPHKKFLIGGALYPADFPWGENVWFVEHVPPPEHPAFYSSSRLTLSVTRSAMADMGYCPSGRLFEAAACATAVVSDTWDGLDRFFEPGREIITAHSGAEVENALRLDPEEIRAIAARARQRVLDEHTAAHRAEEMAETMKAAA